MLTDRYRYSAFGDQLSHTGSSTTKYLFTGEQFDPAAQSYYLRARYYQPRLGRFTSADTYPFGIGEVRELNRYGYAAGNPVLLIDPTGEEAALGYSQQLSRILTLIQPVLRCLGGMVAENIAEQGVYILVGGLSSYVGQSVNVRRRVAQHANAGVKQFFEAIMIAFPNNGRAKAAAKLAREQIEQLIIEILELEFKLSNKVRRPAKRDPLKLAEILRKFKARLC